MNRRTANKISRKLRSCGWRAYADGRWSKLRNGLRWKWCTIEKSMAKRDAYIARR